METVASHAGPQQPTRTVMARKKSDRVRAGASDRRKLAVGRAVRTWDSGNRRGSATGMDKLTQVESADPITLGVELNGLYSEMNCNSFRNEASGE
jgi:hypothetical protein